MNVELWTHGYSAKRTGRRRRRRRRRTLLIHRFFAVFRCARRIGRSRDEIMGKPCRPGRMGVREGVVDTRSVANVTAADRAKRNGGGGGAKSNATRPTVNRVGDDTTLGRCKLCGTLLVYASTFTSRVLPVNVHDDVTMRSAVIFATTRLLFSSRTRRNELRIYRPKRILKYFATEYSAVLP